MIWSTIAVSQPSTLNLRLLDEKWFLDYQPSPLKGSILLHSSSELFDLFSTSVDIIDVPSNSGILNIDVSKFADGKNKFFAATEISGVSASDWNYNIPDEIVEGKYLYDLTTVTAISYPLTTGTETNVHFNIVNKTTGEIALINGSVELELLTASGDNVIFSYTISPSSLPIINGVVNGMVIIQAETLLDGVYISVKDIRDLPGKRSTRSTQYPEGIENTIVGITDKILGGEYQLSRGWNNPLGESKHLVGSFGEWRPKSAIPPELINIINGPGRSHKGVDLAQEKNMPVYAVKSGVVSKHGCVGANSGDYMFVVHGDGTASAYLHVRPLALVGEEVEAGEKIAEISPIEKPHLHLELFKDVKLNTRPGGYKTWNRQGISFNPIQPNVDFDIPLMLPDSNGPKIKGIYFWGADPKTHFSKRNEPGENPVLLANNDYIQPDNKKFPRLIVAHIVDPQETPQQTYVLAPYKLEFLAEKPTKQEFDTVEQKLERQVFFEFHSLPEINKLFQNNKNNLQKLDCFEDFGYTQRVKNQINKEASYEYWFNWDTSIYKTLPLGERTFRIVATDHSDNIEKLDFTIGPNLTSPSTVFVDEGPKGSVFDVEVENFFGPFPSGMGTQKDTVKFSLLSESLKRWEVFFVGPTRREQELGHKDKHSFTIGVRFKDPLAPSLPEKFKIRAESGIYPDIAHEIEVNITTPLSASDSFALIPAGPFQMGDSFDEGYSDELPVHTVNVSAFFMGKREATKALWDEVRTWGFSRGYTDLPVGFSKASDHPVTEVSWFDVIKWCNARSEKDGLSPVYMVDGAVMRTGETEPTVNWEAGGYRLPTEAEWEKAARGGLSGKRFPWGDTISHSQANYSSVDTYAYDVSPTRWYHPAYDSGTSPVGSFAPNEYGLYDMTGNVQEWCWDWLPWQEEISYADGEETDPKGPTWGLLRIVRGGAWNADAPLGRVADRFWQLPMFGHKFGPGFRLARGL
jgi:formylglycine-generating enzyme required for sulfatase activity